MRRSFSALPNDAIPLYVAAPQTLAALLEQLPPVQAQWARATSFAAPLAGAITAALFLQRFIPDGTPWLHLDLFAWNQEDRPGRPRGGEAQGLRALFGLLSQRFPVATSETTPS